MADFTQTLLEHKKMESSQPERSFFKTLSNHDYLKYIYLHLNLTTLKQSICKILIA